MDKLCLIYLLSVIISVSANPLSQQSCSYQPSSYSSPASIPVVIQPSNANPCPLPTTVQTPTTFPGPLGDSLNQIILSKILSNPSLQKIIDPNTKLYNQNGDAVQRQVPNTGAPNVINNYFIVPPEFFNINETVSKNDEEVIVEKVRPRRRKLKRRPKKTQIDSEDDEDDVVVKVSGKKRKQIKTENLKRKRTRVDNEDDKVEIDVLDKSQKETRKDEEIKRNKQKNRLNKKKKEQKTTPPPSESNENEYQDIKDLNPVIVSNKNEIKKSRNSKPRVVDDESNEIETEVPRSKSKKVKTHNNVIDEGLEDMDEIPQAKRSKKSQRKEFSDPEDKVLKNIEIPTDVSHRVSSENRQTRDSKNNGTKRGSEQRQTHRKEPSNITPFPDEVLKNFFPYMPMGNFYNPNSNHPYNFDHYYQYLDPARNREANRNQKRRKTQNRKTNEPNSNKHTIEIKLKPKKKENTTEILSTTEEPKVQDKMPSIEVDESAESFEEVTDIPMEMPHKISPSNIDDTESASKESYETFSKLDDLHAFITPELGNEDEVLPMCNNGIVNDYYPVFDDGAYYNPYVEKVKNLEDDRYFYSTENEDKFNKNRRKFERYEDLRNPKPDSMDRESDNTDTKTKKSVKVDPVTNKYDHNDNLDHISKFDRDLEHEIIKSNDEIRRVKVPPKNTRVKTELVETVSAGSRVAKYGVTLDETVEDTSSYVSTDENSSGDGITYVVAKSLGRPEDYW